jgi:phage-related protein (TIGR01555 family)
MPRPVGSKNKSTLIKEQAVTALQTKTDSINTAISATRTDSWSNLLTGLGSKVDKSKYTEFGELNLIDDVGLSNIYMNDGLGGRIIDVVADDMTREWINLDSENDTDGEEVEEVLITLSAEEHFNEAIKWQRLYGGSLLIVGAMDGASIDKPLREQNIKNIEYLKVVDRTNIQISNSVFDTNPMSPMFGKIVLYHVDLYVGSEYIPMKIHYTRVIPFFNDSIPSRIRSNVSLDMRYWGMSSLQRIFEELRDLGGITQSTVNILYEFIIGKYKISHLAEIMSQPGGERAVVNRMEIMNMSKSVLNSVMIDAEEDYSRDYATLAGLPELIDRFMLKLSGSTGIPVTRLFGRSPAGLNATGENDLRNYYDLVEAQQRNRLYPPLRRLIQLICNWKGIKTIPEIEFNSLYQLSEEEKVKIEKMEAETKQIEANTENTYVQMGALDPDEVRKETLGKTGSVVPDEPEPTEEEMNSLKATEKSNESSK